MKRISSTSTAFLKRVFPVLWFGSLALGLAGVLTGVLQQKPGTDLTLWPVVGVFGAMGVLGYGLMRKLVWSLVDEVWDDGDVLEVRNRGQRERIPLEQIINVSYTTFQNPPRVTLRLAKPGRFGAEIAFVPVTRLRFGFRQRSELVEDLIVRVDKARRGPRR